MRDLLSIVIIFSNRLLLCDVFFVQINALPQSDNAVSQYQSTVGPVQVQDTRQQSLMNFGNDIVMQSSVEQFMIRPILNSTYHSTTVTTKSNKCNNLSSVSQVKVSQSPLQAPAYVKPMDIFTNYSIGEVGNNIRSINDPLQCKC